jgi:hypothetical protein
VLRPLLPARPLHFLTRRIQQRLTQVVARSVKFRGKSKLALLNSTYTISRLGRQTDVLLM